MPNLSPDDHEALLVLVAIKLAKIDASLSALPANFFLTPLVGATSQKKKDALALESLKLLELYMDSRNKILRENIEFLREQFPALVPLINETAELNEKAILNALKRRRKR